MRCCICGHIWIRVCHSLVSDHRSHPSRLQTTFNSFSKPWSGYGIGLRSRVSSKCTQKSLSIFLRQNSFLHPVSSLWLLASAFRNSFIRDMSLCMCVNVYEECHTRRGQRTALECRCLPFHHVLPFLCKPGWLAHGLVEHFRSLPPVSTWVLGVVGGQAVGKHLTRCLPGQPLGF